MKRKIVCFIITLTMIMTAQSPGMMVFADDADSLSVEQDITYDEKSALEENEASEKTVETEPILEEIDNETVKETTTESESENMAGSEVESVKKVEVESEPKAEKEEPKVRFPEFCQSKTVDGVTVSVSAGEGIFPEDASLVVSGVTAEKNTIVAAAVESVRSEDVSLATSYAFDISILDKDGNKLQPADGKSVKVAFSMDEARDKNLDVAVYHITRRGKAQALNTKAEGSSVEALTDGFSYYTVEFTYGKMQYVLNGDSNVRLAEILETVGLDGDVTSASVSDETLFSVSDKTGEWVLSSHKSFKSDEWLKVTIRGTEYQIDVTDATILHSGTYSSTVSWTLDDEGVLRIFPTDGSSGSFTRNTPGQLPPWRSWAEDVKSIVFEDGVAAIGNFSNFSYYANNLERFDGSGLDVSGVTNFQGFLSNKSKLVWVDISGWKPGCTDLRTMFQNDALLETVVATGFSPTEGSSLSGMFSNCVSLKTVDAASWNFSGVSVGGLLFSGCTSFTDMGFLDWDTSNLADAQSMFSGCKNIGPDIDLTGWNVEKLGTASYMFSGCSGIETVDLSGWTTGTAPAGVTQIRSMFENCTSLTSVNFDNVTFEAPAYMRDMFMNCSSLETFSADGFKVNVESTHSMFENCTSLTSVDAEKWDLRMVPRNEFSSSFSQAMSRMFKNCTSLKNIDVSNWDVAGAEYMLEMFGGCSKLETVDMSEWETEGGVNMWNMFANCSSLKRVIVSESNNTDNPPYLPVGMYEAAHDGDDTSVFIRAGSMYRIPKGRDAAVTDIPAIYVIGHVAHFDANGGTGEMEDQLFAWSFDEKTLRSCTFERNRHAFSGWNTAADGSGTEYTESDMFDFESINNTTFYAQWVPQYDVEFYYQENGQYPKEPDSVVTRQGAKGETVSVTDSDKTPKKEGYVFDEKADNIITGLNEDGTLALRVYFKQQFTVSYDPGDHGTWDVADETTRNIDYGADTPAFTRDTSRDSDPGYSFDGWIPVLKEIVTESVTYVAKWVANSDTKYVVECYYEENGEYPETADEIIECVGTTDTEAKVRDEQKEPSKDGYVFDEDAANILSGNINGDGSLVLKIYFKQQFVITFDPNGGVMNGSTDPVSQTYSYGEEISIIAAPTKDGNTFLYWKGSEYQPGDTYVVTDNHTFVAQWKEDVAIDDDSTKEPSEDNTPNKPDRTDKQDRTTPGGNVVKTGDVSNIGLFLILLLAAVLSMVALLTRRKGQS